MTSSSRRRADPTPPVRGIGSVTTDVVARYDAAGYNRLRRTCSLSASGSGATFTLVPVVPISVTPRSRARRRSFAIDARRRVSSGGSP